MKKLLPILFLLISFLSFAQKGSYTNPILHADYSDPDVIRTGDDYWMTSSSFNCIPGLQIMHSTDLVHWEIVGAALPKSEVDFGHGNGVWAPSIRFHDGLFYIFWGDPDRGIFMVTAENPRGEWSRPHLVREGKGMIDPCPLWDEDGRVYLVHSWAGSRAGFKSVLTVVELSADCKRTIGENILVFDGKASGNPTCEGPKFYKRNGWYYIFTPAGGVKEGWQLVLRSKSVYGPYQWRKVLHQGGTDIHGPHQGGWVEDAAGNSWFLHFEDRYAYGRVVHLQPMQWLADGWCTIGEDSNHDGIGEPVLRHKVPAVASGNKAQSSETDALAVNDDFSSSKLSLQWQWHANPRENWYQLSPSEGFIRLNCIRKPEGCRNLWGVPNLLLEKISGETMTFCFKLSFLPSYEGDRAGIVVMGSDYAALGFVYENGETLLRQSVCMAAEGGAAEEAVAQIPVTSQEGSQTTTLFLRIDIKEGAICSFSYSEDGKRFHMLADSPFTAKAGKWIGAKVGFYATAQIQKNDGGRVDVSSANR